MEELGFEQIFLNEEGIGYANSEEKIIALVALADYIPIKKFKQLFEMLGEEIEANPHQYHTLIFDKSTLRTFHQPSMKWYFLEWKTEMVKHGLVNHIKILPKLNYFKKAVEAARRPLVKQFPADVKDLIKLEYADTVEDAIKLKL